MDPFLAYMKNGFDTIEGWPGTKESVTFLTIVREWLQRREDKGGACEIGVHHGKYLIALHNLLSPCTSLGIDVFEDQSKNIDYSGKGSHDICMKNINSFASNPESVNFLTFDSLMIGPPEIANIREKYGRFGIFSVDGGHSALNTAIDLATASHLTSQNGVIAVDDFFDPDWPGVTEGLYDALARKDSPFVPLFITRKKIFLCHLAVQESFSTFVARKYSAEYCREVRFVKFLGWRAPSLNFEALP